MPVPYRFVPVLMAAKWIFTVVQMHGIQPFKPDYTVKLLQYAVEIVHDIVARVVDVARIEAHTKLVLELHAVDDGAQLLKGPPDLAALSGHGFQQHGGRLLRL